MSSKAKQSSSDPNPPEVQHPYYPKDLKFPHYVPNVLSTEEILLIAGGVALLIIILAWIITGRRKEQFCFMRRVVLCWFMLCAFIHVVIEGYFVVYNKSLVSHRSVLGQLWKEYGKSDSRYLISDTFTVCMEGITALIDGPLAFIAFFAFMKGSSYRYSLQMILSLCQLYGDVLYFLTEFKEGFIHSVPDNPLYFYVYFLLINSFWIVIPVLLIIDSARHMAACQTVSDFYIDEYNKKQGVTVINNHRKVE